jgi:hypothetical protein
MAMISAKAALLWPSLALAVGLSSELLAVLVAATGVALAVATGLGTAVGTGLGAGVGATVFTAVATGLLDGVAWAVLLVLAERLRGAAIAARQAALAQISRAMLVSLHEFRGILYLKEILCPMELSVNKVTILCQSFHWKFASNYSRPKS